MATGLRAFGNTRQAQDPFAPRSQVTQTADPFDIKNDPVKGATHNDLLTTLFPGAVVAGATAASPLGLVKALLPTFLNVGSNMLMGESEQDKNYAALRQQQQEHMENVLAPASKGQGPMFRALSEQIADRSKGQMQQTMQRAPTGTSIAREQFRRQKAQEGMEHAQMLPQLMANAQQQYQMAMGENIKTADVERQREAQGRSDFLGSLSGGLFTNTDTGESEGMDMSMIMKLLPMLVGGA